MKRFVAFVVAGVLVNSAAFAEHQMNCDALHGTPLICVFNHTEKKVIKITCPGNIMGTAVISLPNGIIDKYDGAIVSFNSGKCYKNIIVQFSDGQTQIFNGFDVNNNTSLNLTNDH